MKVLLVDHAPIAGGVEMMVRELLTALDPGRVQPVVVTDASSPMRGRFSAVYPEAALPLTRLKRNPLAGLSFANSALQLAQLARKQQADIIQTFTARTNLIGALAGRLAGVPVVWRLNDATLPPSLARLVGRWPRRIIAVSDYLRQFYAGRLTVTDLIPDGVPIDAGLPAEEARLRLELPREATVVTLVARLVRWKGHAVFLKALAQLRPTYPSLQGVVVGGWTASDNQPGLLAGGEPYYHELLALRDSLGLTQQVQFTGHADQPGLYFSASDIVVHASTEPEPFGRVIVEAMAAGRPVIAAAAGGAREIVDDGTTGLLTRPGDVAALAAALGRLLQQPDLGRAMGLAGQARALRDYNLPLMAKRFTDVWQAAGQGATR
jgi:glycosyltransferase involved in cell wall biosynthesis